MCNTLAPIVRESSSEGQGVSGARGEAGGQAGAGCRQGPMGLDGMPCQADLLPDPCEVNRQDLHPCLETYVPCY